MIPTLKTITPLLLCLQTLSAVLPAYASGLGSAIPQCAVKQDESVSDLSRCKDDVCVKSGFCLIKDRCYTDGHLFTTKYGTAHCMICNSTNQPFEWSFDAPTGTWCNDGDFCTGVDSCVFDPVTARSICSHHTGNPCLGNSGPCDSVCIPTRKTCQAPDLYPCNGGVCHNGSCVPSIPSAFTSQPQRDKVIDPQVQSILDGVGPLSSIARVLVTVEATFTRETLAVAFVSAILGGLGAAAFISAKGVNQTTPRYYVMSQSSETDAIITSSPNAAEASPALTALLNRKSRIMQ